MPKLNRVSAAPTAPNQIVQPGTKWTTAESASYLTTGLPVTLEHLPLHLELCPPGLVGPYDLALELAAKARLKEQEEEVRRAIQGRPGWLRRGRAAVEIFCGMGGSIWDFVSSALEEYGERVVREFAQHAGNVPSLIEERLSPGLRLLEALAGARRTTPDAFLLHSLDGDVRSFWRQGVPPPVWRAGTTMHLNGDVSQPEVGLIYCDLMFDAEELMSVAGPGSALTIDPSSVTEEILSQPARSEGLRGPHVLRDPTMAEIRKRLANGTAPKAQADFVEDLYAWMNVKHSASKDALPEESSVRRWINEVRRKG